MIVLPSFASEIAGFTTVSWIVALGAACALSACAKQAKLAGALDGPDVQRGHRLWNGTFPEPTEQRSTGVLIVGGGVAGLSAAWWLQRHGHRDFRLLEGERDIGGNAAHASGFRTATAATAALSFATLISSNHW